VVWIGGLTSSARGFFPGALSIEADCRARVRTILGGLFALALPCRRMDTGQQSIATSRRCDANIPAILTAAGTAVALRTVYALMRCMNSSPAATAFILLDWWRSARWRRPCCMGGAGSLGVAAPLSRRTYCVIEQPDYWRSTSISRSSPPPPSRWPGAAVALACDHHHRLCAALDLPVPGLRSTDDRAASLPCDRGIHPCCVVCDGLRVRTGRGH